MPELKVQKISKSLYVCLPQELLVGDENLGYPPLGICYGDTVMATRTRTGILFEPAENTGSVWKLVPLSHR